METTDEKIKYLEEWYGFYKSIDINTHSNKWLLNFAIDFYEKKLSQLYHQKQTDKINTSVYDLPEMDIISSSSNADNPSSNISI